jgi:DNA-binding LytR/AlgR family response regulator
MIVEDEPLAQNVLIKYIDEHPALELAAVCADGLEAQQVLNRLPVQILFVDINLPKLSGINFIKTMNRHPLVIFTTAYPEFAVEGFELDATDYLLKPFSFERFLKAVNKAIEKLAQASVQNGLTANPSIFLKADKKMHHIRLDDIHYVEAAGDYMKIVMNSGSILVNETMKNLQDTLPANHFIRVHKSYLVAMAKIRFVEGNYIQVADKSIPIGATYREEIGTLLQERSKK